MGREGNLQRKVVAADVCLRVKQLVALGGEPGFELLVLSTCIRL